MRPLIVPCTVRSLAVLLEANVLLYKIDYAMSYFISTNNKVKLTLFSLYLLQI